MKIITIFDTSASTKNIGDAIIMDSVERELNDIIRDYSIFQYKVSTHSRITYEQRDTIEKSKLKIVCGTNLYRMHYRPYNMISNPWKIRKTDIKYLKDTLFLGVGTTVLPKKKGFLRKTWANIKYNYSKKLWQNILTKKIPHSLRDEETKEMLADININNTINTGCPTIWRLDEDHCRDIPVEKGRNAILTISGKKTKDIYLKYIKTVVDNYDKTYIWPQSIVDIPYMDKIKSEFGNQINILPATLKAFDEVLNDEESLDYIGTRLHGGIRALQHKRKSIIIAIDSRAKSFKNDFNLPVIDKDNLNQLSKMINSNFKTEIILKKDRINEFKTKLTEFIKNM
jgi:polysaccharide pyruvyl transferase WcaK-like protein